MKKILTILVVAIVATTSNIYAQYASDALRFSQTNYGSSARFKGLGNAQIGVGGDMSAMGGNPAGLGLFTKSEFSLTPEFNQTGANALYLGQNSNTSKNQLNLNQVGIVFYSPVYKQKGQDTRKGLVSTVFGLGYNRNNDFSFEGNYGAPNNSTSVADYFAQIAGTTTPNKLKDIDGLEGWAYNNYLISYDPSKGSYYPETFADANQSNLQRVNEVRTGSTSEFNFSAAANISNQIYIGATINLVDIRYNRDASYEESGKVREFDGGGNLTGNNINYKLFFNQNQQTKGSGVNGRVGIIFRPVNNFRLGLTLQTPTWFVIDDATTETLDNRSTARGTTNSRTYDFTYNMRTPLKGSLGASYVIAGQALITADVDFVDYSSIRFSTNEGFNGAGDLATINNDNSEVRKSYKSAINYRVGAEYKINTISLRAGYGVNGSPYKADAATILNKKDDSSLLDTKMYSGGIGYRVNNYYLDLAYQRVEVTNNFSPYSLSNGSSPSADIKSTKNNVFLTFGLRF